MVRLTRPWIFYGAMAQHLAWAAFVMVDPAARGASPLAIFASWPTWAMVVVLVLVTALAAGASLVPVAARLGRLWRITLMLPQQTVLVASALHVCLLVWSQHYADGIIRPFFFMAADQLPVVLIAIVHTAALLDFGRGLRVRATR